MPTVRYGDVVSSDDVIEGDTLDDRLKKRRQASDDQLHDTDAIPEDQQPEINPEQESK